MNIEHEIIIGDLIGSTYFPYFYNAELFNKLLPKKVDEVEYSYSLYQDNTRLVGKIIDGKITEKKYMIKTLKEKKYGKIYPWEYKISEEIEISKPDYFDPHKIKLRCRSKKIVDEKFEYAYDKLYEVTYNKDILKTFLKSPIDFFKQDIKIMYSIEIENLIPIESNDNSIFNSLLIRAYELFLIGDIHKIKNIDVIKAYLKYGTYAKNPDFLGFKYFAKSPVTLEINTLYNIYNNEYSITEKADGTTCLLIPHEKKYMLVSPKNELIKTIDKHDTEDYILIGELIENNKVYLFDIFIDKNLKERIKILETLGEKNNFNIKKYSWDFNNVIDIWTKKYKYEIDGLIFTPLYKGIIYKWKPPIQQTIDFYCVPEKQRIYLYVIAPKENITGNVEYKGFRVKKNIIIKDVTLTLFTPNNINLFTTKKNKDIKQGDIWEFKYDNKLWIPIRKREDKTLPNSYIAALSSYNNIINPIELEWIKHKSYPEKYWSTTITKQTKLKRHHSDIKMRLLEKNIIPGNLLDIGGGRANDLHKWKKLKLKKITIVEPDEDAIKEGKERIINADYDIDITYINSDFMNAKIKQKFKNIVLFFSIHYIIKESNDYDIFAEKINNLLDGSLIITTFNKSMIENDFRKYNGLINLGGQYIIKKISENKINVYVKSIGIPHDEYLIDTDALIYSLKKYNINLVKIIQFNKYANKYMEKNDTRFSSYNIAIMFKRN